MLFKTLRKSLEFKQTYPLVPSLLNHRKSGLEGQVNNIDFTLGKTA